MKTFTKEQLLNAYEVMAAIKNSVEGASIKNNVTIVLNYLSNTIVRMDIEKKESITLNKEEADKSGVRFPRN